MLLKKLFLICLYLLCTIYVVISQTVKWHKVVFTTESGLSGNEIFTLAQDSVGYMWFGSVNGLNRFDGLNFKTYTTLINDSTSITDNNVFKIIKDSKGRLIIATAKGLCVYNRLYDNFIRININNGFNAKTGITVHTVLEDKRGNYWLGTQGEGLIKLSRDFHFLHRYGNARINNSGLTSNFIWSLFQDYSGTIWIGDQEGNVYSLNTKDEKISKNLSTNYTSIIDDLFEDKNGNLIVSSFSGIKFYNKENVIRNHQSFIVLNEVKSINDKLNYSQRVYQCTYGFDHNLWFLHKSGFSVIDRVTKSIKQSDSEDSPFGIPYSDISQQVICDNQGNEWIGTKESGVVLFNKIYKNFHSSGSLFKNKSVSGIFEDSDGCLWIGTDGQGLFYINSKDGSFINYSKENALTYGFNEETAFVTYETTNHEIYIGTYRGIFMYKKSTHKFKHYMWMKKYLPLFLSSWYEKIHLLVYLFFHRCVLRNNRAGPAAGWLAAGLNGSRRNN